MTQKEKIERIERKIGITLGVKDGKPYFGGNLDLRGTSITALPEGLIVGGHLDLRETGITALPEGLTVGGALDLEGCASVTSLPEGLTVGCYLDLRGTSITALPEGLTVGRTIYLCGMSITALPEGLTVGGNLDLRGTSITALPEGLIVGGNLDLRGTSITDTTKVRRELTAEQRGKINAVVNRVIEWQWNGRHYIKADDEFTVVDAHRGNVYRVHYLGKSEQLYLVTDGEGHWAHGKTLREAAAFANAVAALSVQKLGTTPSMPTRAEIDAFIAANSL